MSARLLLLAILALAGAQSAASAGADSLPPLPARPLAAIAWSGNAALGAAALEEATGWRTGASLGPQAWEALAAGVTRAYAATGHLAAAVEEVRFADGPGGPEARVTIDEGPLHRFAALEVLGARLLAADQVRAELGVRAGEPWSGARLERGIERLLRRYGDLGRPLTQVLVRRVQVEGGHVAAQIHIVESDSVIVDSVAVEGARRTSPRLLARATGALRGEAYRRELAEEARTRLLELGVFARVGEGRFRLTGPGRGEVAYEVEEAAGSAFDGVFGYQGRDRALTGLARLTLDNIAGTARQASAHWTGRGAGRADFRFRYREPFVAGTPLALGLGFLHELADTEYTRTEYGLEASLAVGEGGSLALALEAGRAVATPGPVSRSTWQGTRATLRLRARAWAGAAASFAAEPGLESGLAAAAALPDRPGWAVALSTAQRFARDRLRPEGEVRRRLFTAALDGRAETRAGRGRFVSVGLEGRFRDGSRGELASYDLFALGGASSLRGYRESQFRSARYALLRLDHGWGGAGTRVHVFVDQAVFRRPTAGLLSTEEATTRYRAGYGFGASVPSALGRLGMEIGWGRGDWPLDAKLHLRLRSRF